MERAITRLEKMDRFAFFLDEPPLEFDENYEQEKKKEEEEEDNDGKEKEEEGDGNNYVKRYKKSKSEGGSKNEQDDKSGISNEESKPREGNDDNDAVPKTITFPDHPPFNLIVLRKRFAAGRYDLDMVAQEMKRRKDIEAMLDNSSNDDLKKEPLLLIKEEISEEAAGAGDGKEAVEDAKNDNDATNDQTDDATIQYEELAKTFFHPVGVDWETFHSDVAGMCDAAMTRDPEGISLGSGHLGFAASKIKKLLEEMYNKYGCRRRFEMEESEAKHKFEHVLTTCGNEEAAM